MQVYGVVYVIQIHGSCKIIVFFFSVSAVKLFTTKEMVLLSIVFAYTGVLYMSLLCITICCKFGRCVTHVK